MRVKGRYEQLERSLKLSLHYSSAFFLLESGHNVDDEGNELSRSRHPGDGTPPSPIPPTSPVAVAEAYHRYHHHLQGKRGMVGNGELQNG